MPSSVWFTRTARCKASAAVVHINPSQPTTNYKHYIPPPPPVHIFLNYKFIYAKSPINTFRNNRCNQLHIPYKCPNTPTFIQKTGMIFVASPPGPVVTQKLPAQSVSECCRSLQSPSFTTNIDLSWS